MAQEYVRDECAEADGRGIARQGGQTRPALEHRGSLVVGMRPLGARLGEEVVAQPGGVVAEVLGLARDAGHRLVVGSRVIQAVEVALEALGQHDSEAYHYTALPSHRRTPRW